jgi:hypothetical protein
MVTITIAEGKVVEKKVERQSLGGRDDRAQRARQLRRAKGNGRKESHRGLGPQRKTNGTPFQSVELPSS